MNDTDLNQLMNTPLSMAIAAIVILVLIALTVRSVIKRQEAMIRDERLDSFGRLAYMNHWRDRTSENSSWPGGAQAG